MTNKPRISFAQLMMLLIGSALMFPYTIMAILHSTNSNQDVWIVEILGMVYLFLLGIPILILSNRFRGLNINEICELILGKWGGKIFASIFLLLFFFCFVACLSLGGIFISLDLLPKTPTWAYLVCAVVPMGYLVYKGAGTIGRISIFVTSYLIITIILFFIMGIQMMDFGNMLPILADSNFININSGAFVTGARISEILILLIFSYYLPSKSSITKVFIYSIFAYLVAALLIIMPTILVLGLDVAKNSFNPYFDYTRQVHGYDFIQRVQAFNALAWFPGLILKLSLYIYMGCYVLSGVFQAKSHKPFVIPFCVLGFLVCLLPIANKADFMLYIASDKVFPWIILPFSFGLPSILLIVYLFRKKNVDSRLMQKKARAALLNETDD